MKMKIIFLTYCLCIYAGSSLAQEDRLKYIGIEAGLTFIESEMSAKDFIRGDIPSYSAGYSTNSLTSLTYRSFVGIKSEILSLNDRVGFFGGIRFSRINYSLGKNNYWTNSQDYFYWLYHQEGVNTEYLKVKEINQQSDYIGIPIEIRYYTAKRPRLFQPFIKLGAEINYLVQTRTDVVFKNPAMNPYQSDLIAVLEQPEKISLSVYGGGGFKLGRDQKPSVSIEACMPYLILTSKSSGFLHPIYGGGFQINFQIPIKSKVQ